MALPIYQSDSKPMSMLQTNWATQLNPVISNPVVQGTLIRNVALVNGVTQVAHHLGRALQGWMLTRQRAAAAIHDSQDTNSMPQLTLSLVSNAAVEVDIYVF